MTDAPGNLRGLSQAARSIAMATRSALQAEWVAVVLDMHGTGWLTTAADTREDAPFLRLPSSGLLGSWLQQEQAVFRCDDPNLNNLRATLSDSEVAVFTTAEARLAAPIMSADRLAGVIVVGPGVAGSVYPVSHLNFLKALSEMAGPMLAAFKSEPGSQAA